MPVFTTGLALLGMAFIPINKVQQTACIHDQTKIQLLDVNDYLSSIKEPAQLTPYQNINGTTLLVAII